MLDGTGVDVRVWDEAALERDGFGGILGVGKGSARGPRLVRVEYAPQGAARHGGVFDAAHHQMSRIPRQRQGVGLGAAGGQDDVVRMGSQGSRDVLERLLQARPSPPPRRPRSTRPGRR